MSMPRDAADPIAPGAGATKYTFSLAPVLFAALACAMTMTAFTSLTGPIARTLGLAPWQAGMALTVGGVMWMLMARPWGVASDRHGRRAMLLTAVGGFTLFYWAMCAVLITSLHLLPAAVWVFAGLVATRAGIGGCYAAIPSVSQALIADHIPPERRAGAMAAFGAANSVGMTLGPALAAALATYSLGLPLYVTAALPLVAVLALWRKLPRGERSGLGKRSKLRLTDRRMRRPMVLAFVAMVAIQISQITVGFFAIDQLGLAAGPAARAAGMALVAVGIGMTGSQLLLRRVGWAPQRCIRIGALVAAVGYGATGLAHQDFVIVACYFVGAAGLGWVFPSVGALAANAVGPHEQGAAAGSIGTSQGLGLMVGPLAGTLLYGVVPAAPYAMIAALLIGVALWGTRPGRSATA